MPFKPGQSGNPNGRPKKERGLTDALEKWGRKTVVYNGKPIGGKRLLASFVWQGILNGYIDFPDGSKLRLSAQDWKDFVKFVYSHIDGPPPTRHELTGDDGGPIVIDIIHDAPD